MNKNRTGRRARSDGGTDPGDERAGDGPGDTWDPDRYQRFRAERDRPAHDLLALVRSDAGARAVDLGCGTGGHTVALHERVGAAHTTGIDTSARMLAEAADRDAPGVDFVRQDLRTVAGRWDVVFSNAALQWVPDHRETLRHLVGLLTPGGQFAFQVPANFGHPSHTVADDLGRSFGLEPLHRTIDAASPADYAEVLWSCGLRSLDVSMRIYGVEMAHTEDVIAWVSGSLLTSFESRLGPDRFEEFRTEYRRRLLDALGDPSGRRPYYYAFPRILCHGVRPVDSADR